MFVERFFFKCLLKDFLFEKHVEIKNKKCLVFLKC